MLRNILAIVAGVVAWIALVTAGGILLRMMWPAYAAVESTMAFDLAMKVARLALSSAALILAAWLAVRVAQNSRGVALVMGFVMLAAFIPIHIQLWSKFPIWYHLTFLVSLIVVPLAVSAVAGSQTPKALGQPAE